MLYDCDVNQLGTHFIRHLRDNHCSQEGGSFVCHYGYNGVCSSLPVEGVSDKDYEDHVNKHHLKINDGREGLGEKSIKVSFD